MKKNNNVSILKLKSDNGNIYIYMYTGGKNEKERWYKISCNLDDFRIFKTKNLHKIFVLSLLDIG